MIATPQFITTWDDPRLAVYRNLKDKELARQGDRFIAEGELVMRRLLVSSYHAESVLLAERRLAELGPLVQAPTALYVVSDTLIHEVVGYRFHSGVLACGVRPASPTLDEVMLAATGQGGAMLADANAVGAACATAADAGAGSAADRIVLVVCPEIANTENLGSMIRLSAGFGATAMVLGELCCDPFYRQSVRVSMGSVFTLPIVRSKDLRAAMLAMRERWGIERVATVLDPSAEPLNEVTPGARTALLFGNEAQGLGPEWIDLCDRKVTIPMKLGTDSLNVAVSAGIILYQWSV